MEYSEAEKAWREAAVGIELPGRPAVVVMKQMLRKSSAKEYGTIVQRLSQPAAERILMIPGTLKFVRIQKVLIPFNQFFVLLVPIVLLFSLGWIWAAAALGFWYLVLNRLQTEINLELGARLLCLDMSFMTAWSKDGRI